MPESSDKRVVLGQDQARQVAWLVYINGIQVPAQSVSVSYGVWSIPEAQVTMVPDPLLHRLGAEDRVSVTIFYCDYWQNPRKQPEFRLMFDGEIVAWSYTNVQKSRMLTFSCVDYMQIFTQLFFFFMSSMDDLAIGTSGDTIGINQGQLQLAGYGAIYPYSLFSQGLANPSSDGDGEEIIQRPVDFAYNVVRSLVKADHPNRTVPGVNFFAPWAQRTAFPRRWIALPYLETDIDLDGDEQPPGIFPILRSVRAQFAVDAVARLASQVGSAGSIWEMIRQILSVVMMELQMLPTAPVYAGSIQDLVTTGPPAPDQIAKGVNTMLLGNYFVKPQFLFGLPPSCNVFFPSQVTNLSYEENYITQPTRMYFSEEALTGYLRTDQNSSAGFGALVRDALSVAHPEEVNQALREGIEDPMDSGKNLLVYPEEFFKGPVVARKPMPRWFMFLQHAQQGNPVQDTDAPIDGREVAPGDSPRDVYRKYAAYEFYKERYARRNGSVTMAFNPYPVPGFPCAVFDRRSTQVDIFGYIMQVQQVMSSRGWQTQISFSYGRTFQEMFELLERNTRLENEGLQLDEERINSTVGEDDENDLAFISRRAEPVGAIAMVPAEPLTEIRDIVQNFDRANAFYRALFWQEPGPGSRDITRAQAQEETERRQRLQELEDANRLTVGRPSLPSGPTEEDNTLFAVEPRKGVFRYDEFIAYQDKFGNEERINIVGIDATTRNTLIDIISKARTGEASEDELELLSSSIERDVSQPEEGEEDDVISEDLDNIETAIRLAQTSTNVSGEKEFVVRDDARPVFESYDRAMQYNARPICTLDQYIQFLGDYGLREGRVEPTSEFKKESTQLFPAHYYIRIRRYRPGPPPLVPDKNISNTTLISSPADGMASQEGNDPENTEIDEETQDLVVSSVPEDFPENRQNWDRLLLKYRENVLNRRPPRD